MPASYYRLTTSKTWHAYQTTTVGSNGLFHFSEAKSHGYYFKVVLPAQGAFESCNQPHPVTSTAGIRAGRANDHEQILQVSTPGLGTVDGGPAAAGR